jgi:hypothetical protein
VDNNEIDLRGTGCEEAHWTQMTVDVPVAGFCE